MISMAMCDAHIDPSPFGLLIVQWVLLSPAYDWRLSKIFTKNSEFSIEVYAGYKHETCIAEQSYHCFIPWNCIPS